MMRFEVSVQLPLLDVDLRDQARARVSEVALAIETEMKLSMRGPKSGRTYMRRGRTRSGRPNIHRASAPGEPPAVDSGNLWNSIATSTELGAVAATVSVGAEYAAFLERGTRRMQARPFVAPLVERARLALIERLRELL